MTFEEILARLPKPYFPDSDVAIYRYFQENPDEYYKLIGEGE